MYCKLAVYWPFKARFRAVQDDWLTSNPGKCTERIKAFMTFHFDFTNINIKFILNDVSKKLCVPFIPLNVPFIPK